MSLGKLSPRSVVTRQPRAMCWSRPVTLAFPIAECLAVAVLLMRGAAQRRAVVFLLPLVVQEAIQYHLWFCLRRTKHNVIDNVLAPKLDRQPGRNARHRGPANLVVLASDVGGRCLDERCCHGFRLRPEQKRATYILLQSKMAATVTTCHGANNSSNERRESAGIRTRADAVGRVCVHVLHVDDGIRLPRWWPRFCTTRGLRGGHQLWPWLQPTPPAPVFWFSATAARGLHAVSFGASVDGSSFTADDVARGGFAAALGLAYMLLLSNPLHMYRAECAVGEPHAVGWLAVHALVMLGPFFLVPLTFLLPLRDRLGLVLAGLGDAHPASDRAAGLRLLSQPACGASCMLPASTLGMGPAAVVHVLRNTEEEPPPGSFLPRANSAAPGSGFVFTSRHHGVGYYRDEGPFREASPAEEELAARREQTMGDGEVVGDFSSRRASRLKEAAAA